MVVGLLVFMGSRPVRARGLKHFTLTIMPSLASSRPVRARGLKPGCGVLPGRTWQSRPVRARGLKRRVAADPRDSGESRPVRARGLKHAHGLPSLLLVWVAPRTGAWIETRNRR